MKNNPEVSRARAKRWYANNQERVKAYRKSPERLAYMREYHRLNRLKKRKQCLEHYGNKCACCGEVTFEFLSFDHKYGGGNKHRRELKTWGASFVIWLIKNNYPDFIQILCHNCNMAIRGYGICPHQRINATS